MPDDDQPTARDIGRLIEGLPPDLFITSPEALEPYARDWTGDHYGLPLAVVRPRSVEDLSTVMRRCHELRLPVVPQGGLTGLVGAAVAAPGAREVVVSLERMTAVRSIDPVGFAMVVEAGCILELAKRAAEARDCLLPITFGAQGSCRIGGNVSTNAGGFNVLRYGMTRDLVLGLEVVLSDGRVWNGLRTLRKNNTGYDLKQAVHRRRGDARDRDGRGLEAVPEADAGRDGLARLALRRGRDGVPRQGPPHLQRPPVGLRTHPAGRARGRAGGAARPGRPARRSLSGLCPDGTRGERTRGPAGAARELPRGRGRAPGRRHDRREPRAGREAVALSRSDGRGAGARRPILPHRRVGADRGHSGLSRRAYSQRSGTASRTVGRSPTGMSGTATSTSTSSRPRTGRRTGDYRCSSRPST